MSQKKNLENSNEKKVSGESVKAGSEVKGSPDNLGKVKTFKQIQVKGRKHLVITEDADIQKLTRKFLTTKARIDRDRKTLDDIGAELTAIARDRRNGATTVTLEGVSSTTVVTFRESLKVSAQVEDMRVNLGPLFERFFEKNNDYKATSDLKKFLESDHGMGIENSQQIKKELNKYISIHETKPNVKVTEKSDQSKELAGGQTK